MRLSRFAARMIRTDDLPEDVQESIYLELGGPDYLPDELPVSTMSVSDLGHGGEFWWNEEEEYDHRNTGLDCNDYIESMLDDAKAGRLPPLVVSNGQISDGRHRLEAYRRAGVTTVAVIRIEDLK